MEYGFALIGCGRIGIRHAAQIAKVGKLLAVCDINHTKAQELASQYDAQTFVSIDEMLQSCSDLDIVSICTPNGLHAEHSIKALEAHKHVLCEKPLCTNMADAKKMIDAATFNKRKLFVVKQNRYNPPVEAVKKLLTEGKLGKIYSFQINCFWNRPKEYYTDDWRGTLKLDGGTLFTQFSHFIDLLYWLLGDVHEVKSMTGNFHHPTIEIEDAGVALLEMVNGAIGTLNYTVNSFEKNMEGSFTLFGEKGTVKIGGQYLNTLEYQCVEDENIVINESVNGSNHYGFYQGSMSNHDKVYVNLIAALKNNNHDFANAQDGLKTVEIIEKIYNYSKFQTL